MGKYGKSWSKYEDKYKRDQYLDNLEAVTKLYSQEVAGDLDITGSFEGQVRAIKVLTGIADYERSMIAQLDRIEEKLNVINEKLIQNNNNMMKKLEQIQQ